MANRLLGVKVVVVENHDDQLRLLLGILSDEGAIALGVTTVDDALEQLDTVGPALLLSDLALDNDHGFALIAAVRARIRFAMLPAIAVTGDDRHSTRLAARRAGFSAYLVKPVDPEVLVTAIEQLLPRAGGSRLGTAAAHGADGPSVQATRRDSGS